MRYLVTYDSADFPKRLAQETEAESPEAAAWAVAFNIRNRFHRIPELVSVEERRA